MKTIVLHGEMADKFCDEISLNARNIHDVINGLTSNFPSFKTYLINQSLIGVNYKLIDEDYTVYDGFCSNFILRKPLYHIVASPQGNSGGGFLGGLGGMGMNALMGYGMQKLSNALNPSEDNETPEYEIIQTNSYLYESNENVIEQGAPVPVVYGQLRVGTKVISSSVHNYDMDFKKSEIFYFNKNTTLDSINGTPAWSFYRPLTRQDDYRRNGITDEAIKTYSSNDSTKYKVKFGGGKNSKVPNPSAGSSPINEDSANGGKGRSTITYGPSVRSALTEDDGGTTVGAGKETRPFVFPPSSATDGGMRPQGKNENCGAIKYSNGTTEIISYKSTASPMTVGGRGNFTRLESVALFSSLEIVSEGPIAGLALPLGDESTFDNGSVTFPLGAETVTEYAGEVQFNEVKFSSSKNLLVDEDTNSEVISIVEDGTINYFGGGSTTATVKANAGPQSVGAHTFNITVDSPGGSVTADAGNMDIDITTSVKFYNNQQDTRSFNPSTNKLFLYDPDDGSIYPNSNQRSDIPHYLDANYIEIDRSDPTTAVFNIEALSNADLGDGLFFEQGEGYQQKQYDIEVDPVNGCPNLQVSIAEAEYPVRTNSAEQSPEPLDIQAALGEGTMISDGSMVNSVIEKLNESSLNIPRTTTSQANMARIFAEHNCPAFSSRCTNNNAWAYVLVGNVFWGSASLRYDDGWFCTTTPSSNPSASSTPLYLKVFLSEYISLSNIDAGAVSDQLSSSSRWFGLDGNGNMVNLNTFKPNNITGFSCDNEGTNVTYSFNRAESVYETDLEESGANGLGVRSVVKYMQKLIDGESVDLGKLILSAKGGGALWGDVLWDAFRGNQAWSTIDDNGNSVSAAKFDILKNVSFLNRTSRVFRYFDVTVGDFVTGNTVRYPKFFSFIPGSGGTSGPNIKVRSGSQFSKYITEELNANLSNVTWSKSAENEESKEIPLTRDPNSSLLLESTAGNTYGTEKRGYYNPLLFPRCQVFVLRKSQRFGGQPNYNYCPTKFNVVANVKGNGMLDGLHLLDMNGYLPDSQRAHKNTSEPPVWDILLNAWTDIFPQDLNQSRPFQYYADGGLEPSNYQDVGIRIVVPNADGFFEANFEINADGTINEDFETDSEAYDLLVGLPDSWSSFQRHLIYTNPGSYKNLCHLTPDISTYNLLAHQGECARKFYIKNADSHIAVPTSVDDLAIAKVEIEKLVLQQTLTQGIYAAPSLTIVTGRPTKVSIESPGKNYIDTRDISVSSKAKLAFFNGLGYGYVTQFEPLDVDGSSGGYKPNCQFYAYGISKSVLTAIKNRGGSFLEAAAYFNFKVLLSTTDAGDLSSAKIIDPGFGFTEVFDGESLFPNSEGLYFFPQRITSGDQVSISNAVRTSFNAETVLYISDETDNSKHYNDSMDLRENNDFKTFFLSAANAAYAFDAVQQSASDTRYIEPNQLFPKQSLKFQVLPSDIDASTGSLKKLRLTQHGEGFLPGQQINNILSEDQSFTSFAADDEYVEFELTITNGKVTQLKSVSCPPGYTEKDVDLQITFSSPTASGGTSTVSNTPSADNYARFRSIFLNDVPIRDNNNRFNFSKYHFDMRIGHYKNSTTKHSLNASIASTADKSKIADEFLLPSNTKFIKYPLYGPRNHGEKDYYYTHSVKNSEVTDICISIKINELHYIYEGDRSVSYINLLPILGAVVGYVLGSELLEFILTKVFGLAAAAATGYPGAGDPVVLGVGMVNVFGFHGPCFGLVSSSNWYPIMGATAPIISEGLSMASSIVKAVAVIGGAFIGKMLGKVLAKNFDCSKGRWYCFKVGELIKNSGEIWPAKIVLEIEHGLEGTTLDKSEVIIQGCATSSYVKDVYLNNLPSSTSTVDSDNTKRNRIFKIYRTTRMMDPVNNGIIEARYKIDAELLSITEYVQGFFSYPNTAIIGTRLNSKDMPSIPKREYIIKGRLLKLPTGYSPVNGSYATSWNGTFESKLSWSSNPAWVIYDLLINEVYGMGKYGITENQIDKWSFYKYAKYCDEKVDVVIDGNDQGQERRHMCNLYLDGEREAYEYIKDILKIYSAKINFSGGQIYISFDSKVQDPIMLFGNSNVTEEGFSYSSTPQTARISACTVDYLDERDNYTLKSEYVEDAPSVIDFGYHHVKIAGNGITRRGEARRLALNKILTRQLEKELIMFRCGLQASFLRIGDVINVMDNNKVSKHSSGVITKVIDSTTIEIDIPASAISTSEILIQIIDDSSTDEEKVKQFNSYTISSKSGFTLELSNALDSSISSGFLWMIKNDSSNKIKPKPYRVKSIKEVSNLQYEVGCVEYIEEKYEILDQASNSHSSTSDTDGTEYYGPSITF